WHYEWVVAHEFLTLTVGEELLADIEANGRKFYEPGEKPAIPVEFSDAAYRFGHSQITPTYRLNDASDPATIFPDCLGGRPVEAGRAIDWSWFFDVGGSGHAPQPSRKLVASLTHALIDLPEQIVGHTGIPEHHSLASRDLQRGAALGLPSGEAVARMMGVEPLTAEECGLGAGWAAETPLWYYVFKEAEVRAAGAHLGPVGARIVAEVLLGLLEADPDSYKNAEPGWRPELPSSRPGHFTMADLVVFAGGTEEAGR
ncbi:MAG: peroxidase, partial [Actinomycetota bacterium]|nr:peroxidase [Actinomycetota bacterium]